MNRRDILKILIFLAVLGLAVLGITRIDRAQGDEETALVREAIRTAAVTCYAVEGAYPDSVDYLRENYRLRYDEDRYLVTYEAFASNRIPDIYVTVKGQVLP